VKGEVDEDGLKENNGSGGRGQEGELCVLSRANRGSWKRGKKGALDKSGMSFLSRFHGVVTESLLRPGGGGGLF
jgi:hypothetical protein